MKKLYGIFLFTLNEALRKGTLLAYFIIGTIIIIVFALGIRVSPEDSSSLMFFGNSIKRRALQETNIADFLLFQLYNGASSSIIFFGLFGTAGMIPSLLEKGTVELFLSKPVSRTSLFLSRCAGALTGITLNILYFTFGIWLIFGLKIGVWNWGFLASALFTSYIFSCYFAIPALAGVVTQSTGVAIIMAFAINILSSFLETRELLLYKIWDNIIYHRTLDTMYYIIPQLGAMSKNAATLIGKVLAQMAGRLANAPEAFTALPYLYSTLSACAIYFLAILHFQKKDY